jgi:hypothetical protein
MSTSLLSRNRRDGKFFVKCIYRLILVVVILEFDMLMKGCQNSSIQGISLYLSMNRIFIDLQVLYDLYVLVFSNQWRIKYVLD